MPVQHRERFHGRKIECRLVGPLPEYPAEEIVAQILEQKEAPVRIHRKNSGDARPAALRRCATRTNGLTSSSGGGRVHQNGPARRTLQTLVPAERSIAWNRMADRAVPAATDQEIRDLDFAGGAHGEASGGLFKPAGIG